MKKDFINNGLKDAKNIDLCGRVNEKLHAEVDDKSSSTKNDTKVTMASITDFNHKLVNNKISDKTALPQIHRQEMLHKMMETNAILKDNTLWYYLDHFKAGGAQQILLR